MTGAVAAAAAVAAVGFKLVRRGAAAAAAAAAAAEAAVMDDRGSGFGGGDHCGRGRPTVGVETRRRVSPSTSGRLGSDGAPGMRRRSPRFRSSLVVLPTLLGWLLHFCFLRRPVRRTRQRRGANTATATAPAQPGRTGPRCNVSPRLAVATSSSVAVARRLATRNWLQTTVTRMLSGVTSANFENDCIKA